MKYKKFGQIDFEVSSISFGGAAISGEGGGYGFGHITEADSIDLLHNAFDFGINLFDTAPIYGFNTSEIRIGKAFAKMREKVFIVSKSGVSWHSNKRVDMNNSKEVTSKMFESSLKNLNTDYIDLYMVHWPSENVDIREPISYLEEERQKGRIKYLGLCNTFEKDLLKAQEVAKIDVVQSELNLFKRNLEFNLNGLGFMSWGTLDKGILTGRVYPNRKYDQVDARAKALWWRSQDKTKKLSAIEKLKVLVQKYDISLLDLALGFNLSRPFLSTAICGARNIDQLKTLVQSQEKTIEQNIFDEAIDIIDGELK